MKNIETMQTEIVKKLSYYINSYIDENIMDALFKNGISLMDITKEEYKNRIKITHQMSKCFSGTDYKVYIDGELVREFSTTAYIKKLLNPNDI